MENYMKLEIPAKHQNESFARVVVAAFASQLDPTLEEVNDIKTAVSEAVTNAIIHGYGDETGSILIEGKLFKDRVEVEVIDFGKGIEDVDKARQPLFTTRPELERSGMGFIIMEKFMDRVEVFSEKSKGTRIKMEKKITKKEGYVTGE